LNIKGRALSLLKKAVGNDAEFRDGQWEAIEYVLTGKKTLVVQRTGWGKSIVYFIATKLLREQGKGVSILISPLLSLIRDQILAAEKIGLKALSINSDNKKDWEEIYTKVIENDCDVLLISPERLANQSFNRNILGTISQQKGIGLLVVDEAHCISDWGHDFRPDYRRIVRISNSLPKNVPLLATTATANNRVINDIKEQIGDDLQIVRGNLMRKSLKLQAINLKDQTERLAWIYENINKMPGAGIIYCLTKGDCDRVARWLRSKGINALEYHTSLSEDSIENSRLAKEREDLLMNNQVKALVSTVKLGMGYDKPDLGFVIHFQRPGSIVAYYQQIGRAGRQLDTAYTVLLNGAEDDEIHDFFINSAFPSHEELKKVLQVVEDAEEGLSSIEVQKQLNMSGKRIGDCLKMLLLDMAVSYENNRYWRTPNKWEPDLERIARVTQQKNLEMQRMKDFVDYQDCYMQMIANELDDPAKTKCGKCSNCIKNHIFPITVEQHNVIEAKEFFKKSHLIFNSRKQIPKNVLSDKTMKISAEMQNENGYALSNYGDAGWGIIVKEDKYRHNYFRDELVDAMIKMIRGTDCINEPGLWLTSIPSIRHPELVKNFAQRVAKNLQIPYKETIIKAVDTKEQKTMENSFQQAKNANEGFALEGNSPKTPVILIDDMVDSKWTLTICGYLLKSQGVSKVYPFVLASTAAGGLT